MAIPKYTYMENPKHDLTGFKIEEGKYKDVVYTYGKVSPIEEIILYNENARKCAIS